MVLFKKHGKARDFYKDEEVDFRFKLIKLYVPLKSVEKPPPCGFSTDSLSRLLYQKGGKAQVSGLSPLYTAYEKRAKIP